jgi:photosystem II stability/assembly factor-like uncharacterized protein
MCPVHLFSALPVLELKLGRIMLTTIQRRATKLLLAILVFVSVSTSPLFAVSDEGNVFTDPENKTVWQVLGPNGGDVRSIVIDPRNKEKVFISTMDGQVHVSTDAGKTWRLLASFGRAMFVVDQLMVDSRDSNVLYASGHRGKLPGGFFKSTDGGVNWKESKDLREQAVHAMAQSQTDANVIYAGTKEGIWMSKDSGDDWERIESATMPLDINSFAADPKNSNTLYAGTTWRPYKSTDNGKSWRLIKSGMIDDSDIFAITIDSENNNHLIASACSGIYESVNGGENWRKIQGIPGQSRRTRDIVQHPSRPGTLYAGTTEGFWMSVNGGKSWSLTTPRNIEINKIAVHPDEPNRVFIATNNFGVMVSNDGGRNFVQTNTSFTSRFTYSITPDVEQPDRLYATTMNTSSSGGFFFYSEDGGQSWLQAKGLDTTRDAAFTVLQDRLNPNLVYMGTNRGIFKSLDRGASWTLIAPPKPPVTKGRRVKGKVAAKKPAVPAKKTVAAPAAAEPEGPKLIPVLTDSVRVLAFTNDDKSGIIAGTDKGLYRTYDIAKGWEKLPFGNGIEESVFVVHSTPLVPGTMWVGTARAGVLVSTDDGKTWSKVNATPDGTPISSIATDPKRPNYIYVGTIHGFYLSRDGGRTWMRRGGNLPLGNFTSILIDPNDNDTLIIASALETEGGIFISENAGMNWKRLDSKDLRLPSRRIWALVFDPHDSKRMYAGTHSSGVYKIERNVEAAAKNTTPNDGN